MYRFKHDPKKLFVNDTHPELPLDPDVIQPGAYKWPPHFLPSLQVLVFIGGCFGTLARYGVGLVFPVSDDGLPFATLSVNLAGAFLLGLLLEGLARSGQDHGNLRRLRLGIGTGFMGAFTTYSAFALDAVTLHKNGHDFTAIAYIVLTLAGGLICSTLGIFAATEHHKRKTRAAK